jgi:hypothetical protein
VSESETFRSPVAIAIWWVWVLFAAGNLADLAVQGRDRLSVVAAFVLLFVTGIVWVTAKRPKVVAAADALTVVNPLRDHQVRWAAVTEVDTADLLRVRCEWPAGEEPGKRVIYAWAVHASRRRQAAAEMRERRRASRSARDTRGFGGSRPGYGRGLGAGRFGAAAQADSGPAPAPLGVDAGRVVGTLNDRAEVAKLTAPDAAAAPPVSTWSWPAVAALVLPALALLIAALV